LPKRTREKWVTVFPPGIRLGEDTGRSPPRFGISIPTGLGAVGRALAAGLLGRPLFRFGGGIPVRFGGLGLFGGGGLFLALKQIDV
jgi:hypothetical protein